MSKLTTSLVVALGLVASTGCKKKHEEGTVQKPTEGVTKEGGSAATMAAPEKPMSGADLAKKYLTCVAMINDSKLDDFKKDCVDASYTGHEYGHDMSGADTVIGYFQSMKKAMPDWKLTPQIVMVNGPNILAVVLATGTQSGELALPGMPPIPATNKKVGQLFFHKLAINEQNKAVGEWAFDDPATMMGQLGLAPKDAPPTRPAMDKGLEGAPIVVVADTDAKKEAANLDAFKKGMEALNTHKTADAMAFMTDDAIESDQTAPKDAKGKKEIEAGMKMFFGAFSDAKVTASETYAAGDYVVAIGKFEGTNDKDLGKIKKTGKKVSLDYAEVALMKDGKIAQLWRFHSGMQFAGQMGLMPAAPPGGAGSAAPAGAAPAGAAPAGGSAAPAAGSAAAPTAGSAAAPADNKPATK
jgi:predicted ester cyclase